jgi:hypothetical protein
VANAIRWSRANPWIEAYKAKGARHGRSSTALLSGVQKGAFVEVLNGRFADHVKAFASANMTRDEKKPLVAVPKRHWMQVFPKRKGLWLQPRSSRGTPQEEFEYESSGAA